jgi:hypothetical protein
MRPATSTLRAFISYSAADRDFAKRICDELRKHAVEPFIDYASIRAGDDWMERLGKEILDSNIVLLILSPDSVQSKWVRREFSFAERNQIPVIPLMHRATNLPIWLSDIQFADFQTSFEDGLQVLLLALRPETVTALAAEAAPSALAVEAALSPAPEIVATATAAVAPEVAPPEPGATIAPTTEAPPLTPEQETQRDRERQQRVAGEREWMEGMAAEAAHQRAAPSAAAKQQHLARQQAIAGQLAKPLTTAEVQLARLSREERIEQEKQRLAARQRANPRKFLRYYLSGTLDFMETQGMFFFDSASDFAGAITFVFLAFAFLSGMGLIIGLTTQAIVPTLVSIAALGLILYLFGFRKVLSVLPVAAAALLSAGVVFLLMRYIPTLHYDQGIASQLPLVGNRMVFLGRELFAALAIGGVIGLLIGFSLIGGWDPDAIRIWARYVIGVGYCVVAFVLAGLLIAFNWGFGLTLNLGYVAISLFLGLLPGFFALSSLPITALVIVQSLREKTLVERLVNSRVRRNEWLYRDYEETD